MSYFTNLLNMGFNYTSASTIIAASFPAIQLLPSKCKLSRDQKSDSPI